MMDTADLLTEDPCPFRVLKGLMVRQKLKFNRSNILTDIVACIQKTVKNLINFRQTNTRVV